MRCKLINTDSPEYFLACKLRYQVFFAEYNLPFSILFDDREAVSFHIIIANELNNQVIAYGKLTPNPNQIYQISQMVVSPDYQRQGLGKQIILALIAIAEEKKAKSIILDARILAVGFYQKFGFEITGSEHPSTKTGIAHIYMRKQLVYSRSN